MEPIFQEYTALLKRELVPALGCTEPIAIAYAAAVGRKVLNFFPENMVVACSGNVIKNAKSVLVPNAGNLHGIAAAALMGLVGGNPDQKMEVLSSVTPDVPETVERLLEKGFCKVERLETEIPLVIQVRLSGKGQSAEVEISGHHSQITRLERNGKPIESYQSSAQEKVAEKYNYPYMDLSRILDFAEQTDLTDLLPLLRKEVACNRAIAEEGLKNRWGAGIGATLLEHSGDEVGKLACAYAAAGSDARMGGCTLPVIINSGSGNQGLTASLPVIMYAEFYRRPEEQMYRALIVSNLVAIYQKSRLGTLSAFCGAVCAAAGCGAGIAYLMDGKRDVIEKTVTNTLATVSGIICDGAKPSCAAKIASAVNAAILGYHMAAEGKTFFPGDGIVGPDADATCRNAMRVGAEGMKLTERTILQIMME